MILRAEKGFIVIGKDSDGMSRPMDLGMSGPLAAKKVEFIGRRSLFQAEAQRPDRNQLVGLLPTDGMGVLPVGGHGIDLSGTAPRSIGYVTSSYQGVGVDHPVALGLIERSASRHGEEITIQHLAMPVGLLGSVVPPRYALRLARRRMLAVGVTQDHAASGWAEDTATTPMTGALAVLQISGPRRMELFARASAIDPRAGSHSAALNFAGVTAALCQDDAGLRLHVDRSLVPFLFDWIAATGLAV